MPLPARIALAFVLSLVTGGVIQQAAMINDRANGPLQALKPLAVCILLVTLMFGAVAWWRPSAIGRTAAAILAVMLVVGVAVYIFGVSTMAPGIGGNIGYMMAMLVDFYFLLPSAAAVAIHWKLLQRPYCLPRPGLMEQSSRDKWRAVMRRLMAAFYLAAGTSHLMRPDAFLPIVPEWVPLPRETILITGLCELAGAVALLTPRLRKLAGIMLALYAVCVWPANIKHVAEGIDLPPIPDTWWYHGPRLALQPVLIWWALFCSGAIDWPWRPTK